MIVGLVGRALRAIALLTRSGSESDLDRLGDELVRLERRPRQRPPTSR